MTRGYNELVGLQARFSKVIPRYSLTHLYRWKGNDKKEGTCSMRGYDMRRYLPVDKIVGSLCEGYAPAIVSIWRNVTDACLVVYLQFDVNANPLEMHLDGVWEHWAEK